MYSFSKHTYSINMKNETNDKLLLVLYNTTGKQASSTSKLSSQISKLKCLMKLTLTWEVCVLLKHGQKIGWMEQAKCVACQKLHIIIAVFPLTSNSDKDSFRIN